MLLVLVHGGAGDVPQERIARHVDGCVAAARAGYAALARVGTVLDAVVEAVVAMEDDPVFNAGTGACLTRDGGIELDAAVMDGRDLRFGGVAALPPFRNPIRIARSVLEDGEHILYASEGAAEFASRAGFERVPLETLRTDGAVRRLEEVRAKTADPGWAGGTVGAVACDREGHVACATSTGGRVGKRPGRIGDTPLIGCGTWADDRSAAVSATGHGEHIARVLLARVAAEIVRAGGTPKEAADGALVELAEKAGGRAGLIVVDGRGRIGIAKTTRTLTHAWVTEDGEGSGA